MIASEFATASTGQRSGAGLVNYGSILIVTYGRSGSTLLQGLMNSIDGVLVRGENTNFCVGLFQAYKRLCETQRRWGAGSGDPTHAWYGAAELDPQLFLADAWQMVRRQIGDAPVVGFKEIRYFEVPELAGYLDFLALLFPAPAFVTLTRNLEEVARSGWWREQRKEAVIDRLSAFESRLDSYAAGRPNFYNLDYSDLTHQTDRVAGLFRFLGVPYDEVAVGQVLAKTHSSVTEPAPRQNLS